ncbi:hypothetical protein M899_0623 [Bacteriovorax sp. BSW11_IV]|uniref:hypothetical protein n=1 Tax=Bacteriovorax sp. BSW11_IV TaxID=1353529 RepID=UPI00038A2FA5|nr:hypothetical protein [Bacteriovorax sp. BSW11_IV]EQC48873.1 hypothetical protein M899_0623 [Bacteriovorax sp. BSW11_IV]
MKKMIFMLIATNSVYAAVPKTNLETKLCHSSKEYITTFRYLESEKQFSLERNDIKKIADTVSRGCENAAKRFIDVNSLLVKAGVQTADAIKIAMKYSNQSDEGANTYITIFKEAFLKDYLDLDVKAATELAEKLSFDKDGDAVMIKNDFQKIVRFCLDNKGLDLSGPRCAEIATKIADYGVKYNQEMGYVFTELFTFLTKKSGADLATYKGLELAIKLTENGPLVAKNFQDAYKFAISKKGLDYSKSEAINFAELMTSRSMIKK